MFPIAMEEAQRNQHEHDHCQCVGALLTVCEKLLFTVGELQEAQRQHIDTHRREALLGLPMYDKRAD